jgi:hypothetical protein
MQKAVGVSRGRRDGTKRAGKAIQTRDTDRETIYDANRGYGTQGERCGTKHP